MIVLSVPIFFATYSPTYAQECRDAAGNPIPCPTEEPTDVGNEGSTGGSSSVPPLRFLALDENYLNPKNWNNGGRIPGVGQTALLDAQLAVIDPRDPAPIPMGNLTLRNGARLIIYDAVLQFDRLNSDGSAIEAYNAHLKANVFIDPGGLGGFSLNPSFLEADYAVLYEKETTSSFGIGGIEQAGEGKLGKGHYAHLQAERIRLGGQLKVFFVYDFEPQAGQVFQIITVNRARIGEFENAPEGAVVGGYCDVELVLSYTGGDGNDVTLTAQQSANPNPEWACNTAAESQPQPESAESTQPTPEPNMESETNMMPYLIGGGILVLIGLLVLWMRKRKA